MVSPISTLKIFHPLQVIFSNKKMTPLSSTSSTPNSIKMIKTLVHTLIFSHMSRIVRTIISKAKSIIMQILNENYKPMINIFISSPSQKKKKKEYKIFFGSFRLHYNWACSSRSHVMPVPAHLYYDSTWNNSDQQCDDPDHDSQLSGYLHWLEEKKVGENVVKDQEIDMNEIDKLAEMFIASCHEKFRLEKQESYRKFQEMLARGL